jgi:RTX calcium-binding nonapeptide repeat (4 copies)
VLDPDWSPDGDGLAFVATNACVRLPGSYVFGPDGVVLAAANPTGCVPPSDTCVWVENRLPVVSPDGTQVAYLRYGGLEPPAFRVVGADGSGDRPLAADTVSLGIDWRPLPATPPAGVCDRPGARRGSPRSDLLVGTRGDDVICGGAGADVLVGRGGDDILVGGPGADVLLGGDGMDRMFGEVGADQLLGGSGDDILVGGPGRDLLRAGSGADSLLSDDDGAADADLCGRGADLVLADASDTRRGCSP